MKKLWEILVPNFAKDGTKYALDHHHKWDEKVKEIAGGITILKPAKGIWISPVGKLFREEMIPVRIYCTEEDIESIIAFTLTYYDQEVVMAYEVSNNVKIRSKS